MVPQKPHGGLRFGVQIPPCHEMPFETLCFSEVIWFVRGSARLGVVSGQRHWKEGAAQHTASGLQAPPERPGPYTCFGTWQQGGKGTGDLGSQGHWLTEADDSLEAAHASDWHWGR